MKSLSNVNSMTKIWKTENRHEYSMKELNAIAMANKRGRFFRPSYPSSLCRVSCVRRLLCRTEQTNEAIFITSIAANSNINFQFSECHLLWLTDIINSNCMKIPPNRFNFTWDQIVCTVHTFVTTFSHSHCFVLFSHRLFIYLFSSVLLFLCFVLDYAINHPFVCWMYGYRLPKPTKLISQIQ